MPRTLHTSLLLALALALPVRATRAAPSPNLKTGLDLLKSQTRRNLKRGAKLVHMAAVEGETQAEYVMGYLYMKGKGTNRSPGRAVRWFRRAAAKGHVKAQLALGRLLGRSRNEELRKEAWSWLEKAHVQGAPTAKHLLNELSSGRVGKAMMQQTERAVAPAGSGNSRPPEEEPEVIVINMGRGEPATAAEEAEFRKRDEARYAAEAARQQEWAKQASSRADDAAESRKADAKAEEEAAEARRREAADRAARRAAGLPELPRGQLSPHLREKDDE